MATQTRYLTNDSITNNGLSCRYLSTSQSSAAGSNGIVYGVGTAYQVGIRVWKRSSGGTETEITSGTPVAQVSRSVAGEGIQSATWNCQETALDEGDSIVVRVYHKFSNQETWTEANTWQTEDLPGDKLNAITWTIYYYTRYVDLTSGWFHYGSSTYNSRIENFQYTVLYHKTLSVTEASVCSFVRNIGKTLSVVASASPEVGGTGVFKTLFKALEAFAFGLPAISHILGSTSATITFTLLDDLGSPLVGKTVTFTTSHGSLNPESDVTDVNGQVSTVLTATTMGLAIVKAVWAGDATNPRTFETIEVSVHDNVDSPDPSKEYDVWVQGQKISDPLIVNVVESGSECMVTVETDDTDHAIEQGYDYAIYRRGIKIFMGRIEVITKRIAPDEIIKFQGRSFIQTLLWIPIATASYTAQTLKTMIESIISTYVDPLKQVAQGTISPHLDNITATVEETDTTAYDLLQRIARLGGASLFVNKDREVNIV